MGNTIKATDYSEEFEIKELSENAKASHIAVFYSLPHEYMPCYAELYETDKPDLAIPITVEAISNLMSNIATANDNNVFHIKGLVPERILFVSPFKMIWYSNPQQRTFNVLDKEVKCSLPYLIFIAKGKDVYVFASKTKPSMDSVLYKAPFPNNYDDGKVCMGSASIGHLTDYNAVKSSKEIENIFFNSKFTHLLGHQPCKDSLEVVYKNSKAKFENSQLIKSPHKLYDL